MDITDMLKMTDGDQQALRDLIDTERAKGDPKSLEKLVPKPPIVVVVGEGQMKLSDMTDGRLPASGIDHVFNVYPHGHWDTNYSMDIPDVDDEYYWDAEVLEAIITGYILNERILLQGFPGTGKTTAIKQFSAWIQQPYMKLGGKDGVEASSFLGYAWGIGGGEMEFKLGMLPQGLMEGYMICIDEIFKLPAGIMMSLQSLLEKDGVLIIDDLPGTVKDKTVVPVVEARIFTTDNVLGQGDDIGKFAATQLQDTSTLDRIGLTIKVDYLSAKHEEAMMMKRYPKHEKREIVKLISLANLVRSGYAKDEISLTLSPRGLMVILSICEEVNLPLTSALKLSFINKIADDGERTAIKEFIRTVKL